MEKRRCVKGILSVFDLTIGKALNLPESLSTRVMLLYDEKSKTKEFQVLDQRIPREMKDRISRWLEENVDIDQIIHGLTGNKMNADEHLEAA
jgi:hypothetical protein